MMIARRVEPEPRTGSVAEDRIAELQATIELLTVDRLHLAGLLAEYAVELEQLPERGAA